MRSDERPWATMTAPCALDGATGALLGRLGAIPSAPWRAFSIIKRFINFKLIFVRMSFLRENAEFENDFFN